MCIRDSKVHMAVIAVPADSAQDVCDELVKSGILAILNFTPVHLTAGPGLSLIHISLISSCIIICLIFHCKKIAALRLSLIHI